MKISKYTFFFDIENTDFYAYNTLSNALIEIDQESYNINSSLNFPGPKRPWQ